MEVESVTKKLNGKSVRYLTNVSQPRGEDEMWGVKKITYYTPMGEGDRHYCDIYMSGKIIRLFNPDEVIFKEEENE